MLNLSTNMLGDISTNELLSSMVHNKHLKALHLNDNQLSDRICEKLADILLHHDKLTEVYLRWNNISSYGGKKIFESAMKVN